MNLVDKQSSLERTYMHSCFLKYSIAPENGAVGSTSQSSNQKVPVSAVATAPTSKAAGKLVFGGGHAKSNVPAKVY